MLVVLPLPLTIAQSGNGYDLTCSTVDSGGSTSTGNGYELNGTIGQPDASPISGDGYELNGGFWFPRAPTAAPCTIDADCKFDPPNNACNHATCPVGSCSYNCVKYGDVVAPAAAHPASSTISAFRNSSSATRPATWWRSSAR